jgi:hypothetical protein
MTKLTIDPSIAVELDIDSLSLDERVEILFDAEADWIGNYEVKIYNSNAKNAMVSPSASLLINAKSMKWIIEPNQQNLSANTHYYEIYEAQTKRVIFKGKLVITK